MADSQFRNNVFRYDPGMGLDEICDALNKGLYIGVDSPSGATPPISSALIGFTAAGIGAVARTVQSKERDIVARSDYDTLANYQTARDAAAALIALGDVEVNKGLIVRGRVDPANGGISGAQGLEVHSATDAGLGMVMTGAPGVAGSRECFFAHWGQNVSGAMNKLSSISTTHGDTASDTTGYAILRLNATFFSGVTRFDDLILRLFGGKGVTVNANNDTDFPPVGYRVRLRAASIYGNDSRILLNDGDFESIWDANTDHTSHIARNISTGNAASIAIQMGNDASPAGMNFRLFGSNHATKPNWLLLQQEFGAPFILGQNGAEAARLQNGAFGVVDGITAPGTVAGVTFIYVDTADGDLKVKFGDGVVKTIATDV